MPICYSRCEECGEWVLPVSGMDKQSDAKVVCLDCLHRAIDELEPPTFSVWEGIV